MGREFRSIQADTANVRPPSVLRLTFGQRKCRLQYLVDLEWFSGEQQVKPNFQAQLLYNRRYLRCNLEKETIKKLNDSDAVL